MVRTSKSKYKKTKKNADEVSLRPSKTANPVEQLQMLRSFVDGCFSSNNNNESASNNFSERQLTECLRQCGYNVERAAELLLTGSCSSANDAAYAASSSSSFSSSARVRVRPQSSSMTKHQKPKAAPKAPPKPPPSSSSAHTKNANANASNNNNKSDNGPSETIIEIDDDGDDEKEDDGGSKSVSSSFYPAASASVVGAENRDAGGDGNGTNNAAVGAEADEAFLLCERWISDGFCTLRKARVAYQQTLEFFPMGKACVRFRSIHQTSTCPSSSDNSSSSNRSSIEGRLSDGLAAFLAPLLLEDGKKNAPCVRLEGKALMELEQLPVGAQVPMAIQVWIYPHRLFGNNNNSRDDDGEARETKDAAPGSASASSLYFHKGRRRKKQHQGAGSMMEEDDDLRSSCVFRLLQWAEYGEVLPFTAPSESVATTNKNTGRKESSLSSSEEEDEELAKELKEEDFEEEEEVEKDGGDDSDESPGAMAASEWAQRLPLAEEPQGWQGGVVLRPYQRQALHWMLERERGPTQEEWEQQLALLDELLLCNNSNSSTTNNSNGQTARMVLSQGQDVMCECGPVLVSDRQAREGSSTLDGEPVPAHHHPLWKQRFFATRDLRHTVCFYVNEVLQTATTRPPPPPTPCSGGILADSMGLGKTVMLLALILKSKELQKQQLQQQETQHDDDDDLASATATLVVAKLSLLPQWEEEIKSKTSLTYAIYYGQTASSSPSSFFEGVDVVLTTYGTLQGELTRKNPLLLRHSFLRVILDEAHCIKNHKTLASRVCCKLQAQHRWCVSGTVLQNSLDDVYGMIKFLKHEPWCHGGFWKTVVTKPSEQEEAEQLQQQQQDGGVVGGLRAALDRVRRLLLPLMLRRTKSSLTSDGKPILTLPPVETKVISVTLSEREREFYNALLDRSMQVFDGFVEAGTVHKSYFQIFSLLGRLRQVCDHISLTVRTRLKGNSADDDVDDGSVDEQQPKESGEDALGKRFLEGLLSRFVVSPSNTKRSDLPLDDDASPPKRQKENYLSQVANTLADAVRTNATHVQEECPICLEQPRLEEAVLTPCGHIFCRSCLVGYLRDRTDKESAKVPSEPTTIRTLLQCPDGECPCCNGRIDARRIIALSKSKTGMGTHYLTDSNSSNNKSRDPPPSSQLEESMKMTTTTKDRTLVRQILRDALDMESSSKMTAIFQELDNIWTLDPGSKVLIFSHYLGFLDLLECRLQRDGITFFRLDGSLNLSQRSKVLEEFRNSSSTKVSSSLTPTVCIPTEKDAASQEVPAVVRGTILLISMSAGGEGLNLTAASTCFLTDPWWNAAKEDQCVNRIHRIGQTASQVRVRKFVVSDSVEERIIELQHRKSYMAGEIYRDEGHREEGSTVGGARLSLEEFRHLFRK